MDAVCSKPYQSRRCFRKKFTEEFSGSMMTFKAARLFVSHKIQELKPSPPDRDCLKAFPFLNDPLLIDCLKRELPAYIAEAADLNGSESETIDTLAWWKKYQTGFNQSVKPFLYSRQSVLRNVFFRY